MKFKNSYILLIVMTLFLLVSIGSVCASDDNATDDAVLASDDGEVDVLAGEEDTGEDTTQEKINTTVTVDNPRDKYEYDEDKNITVSVKDNESQRIDVNESELSVLEGSTPIGFTYNNSVISITDGLSVGIHNLTINYLGNANYTESSTNFLLKIMGNTTLSIPETIVSDGRNVEIHLDIFDGVDHLTVDKSKVNLNLTYIDGEGNVQSKIINQNEFIIENNTVRFQTDVRLLRSNLTVNYTEAVEPKTARIILATRVEATAEPRIRDTEDKNITVKVYDGQNNELVINQSDLKILDNGKEITNFNLNESVITISSLAIGEHNLTIKFNKADYNASSEDITIKVWGNETFAPQTTANVDADKKVYITLNLSDGVDSVAVEVSKVHVRLFYTIGSNTSNKTVDEIALFDLQTISFTVNEKFDSAYVDITYEAKENNLTARTTIKQDTSIVVPASMEEAAGKVIDFITKVYLANGTPINVTTSDFKVYSNGKEIKSKYNDSSITFDDTFAFGVYNITVKYLGNQTYSEVAKSFMLTVYGINATSSVKVNSSKGVEFNLTVINGTENVTITPSDLNITYINGNETVKIDSTTVTLNNGTLTFTLPYGNFTTAILNIKYGETETNVTLNRVYNVNITAVNTVAEYQSGTFTFKLVDIDDSNEKLTDKTLNLEFTIKSGSITWINTISTKINDKNEAIFKNSEIYISYIQQSLDIGNNTVKLSGTGFNINNASQTVTITKANINIKIDAYKEYYGSTKKIKITVTNKNTGEPIKSTILHLYLPATTKKNYYFQTNDNGISEINVKGFVSGTYDLTVNNNDTEHYNVKSVKGSFTILKIPVVINAKNVKIYYNSGNTLTLKVTKNGKGVNGVYVFIRLYTTSSKHSDYLFKTNAKGEISFKASLNVGKHKIIIASADNRYGFNQATKTITVKKASAKITAKKVTSYYKGGKYFTIKLTNTKNKKPVYDAKVNIKLFISKNRYYNYYGNTGLNGQLKLLLDSLKPGVYKIVISGANNKNYAAKTITSKVVIKQAPAKLTPKKLTAKKGAKKYFTVTVKNKKTKKVISGVKVKIKVYTGKKAKTYTAKTNAKGIAKISTAKLKVGKHKVVVTSGNKYVIAKQAKSTIKIKK